MSLEEYHSALPHRFHTSNKQKNRATEGIEESSKKQHETLTPKGFVDIIEYHTQTIDGPETQWHKTNEFTPGGKRKKKQKAQSKYDDYAIVLCRTWQQIGRVPRLVRLELIINSTNLADVLRKTMVNCYETTNLDTVPIKLQSPFSEIFFYKQTIQKWASGGTTDSTLQQDAKHLERFIQQNGLFSSILDDYEKYVKNGQIVSDILWTIYPPNSLLVVKYEGVEECWVCRNVSIQQIDEANYWLVTGFRIGFDGSEAGLTRQSFSIPMTGIQILKISDLPVIPIKHYKDWGLLKAKLQKRAKVFQNTLGRDLQSFKCRDYSGPSFESSPSEHIVGTKSLCFSRQIEGRVIVDYVAFHQQDNDLPTLEEPQKATKSRAKHKTARGFVSAKNQEDMIERRKRKLFWDSSDSSASSGDENIDDDVSIGEKITEYKPYQSASQNDIGMANEPEITKDWLEKVSHQFGVRESDLEFLYPALVPGFSLKVKEWGWLRSDELTEFEWNKEAFKLLKMKPVTKNLVEALVKGHESASVAFDDIVSGKGQGLVFLLHGRPGLGKTLTAESVAEYLGRPLYSISGGELGTDVEHVEGRLDTIFDLTKRWNAVVLLDEADVLLCKRNSKEIHRNAIVGVFLRKIEYFQGVLFLTTNRKEDFDEAFKSRIHVTISFHDHTPEVQADMWKDLVTANTKKNLAIDKSWSTGAYAALGRLNFNGRTIKNILRTAVAYASSEDKVLRVRHVCSIIKAELEDDLGEDVGETNEGTDEIARKREIIRLLEEVSSATEEP